MSKKKYYSVSDIAYLFQASFLVGYYLVSHPHNFGEETEKLLEFRKQ